MSDCVRRVWFNSVLARVYITDADFDFQVLFFFVQTCLYFDIPFYFKFYNLFFAALVDDFIFFHPGGFFDFHFTSTSSSTTPGWHSLHSHR